LISLSRAEPENPQKEYEACMPRQLHFKNIENAGNVVCTIELMLDYFINGDSNYQARFPERYNNGEACYGRNKEVFDNADELCSNKILYRYFLVDYDLPKPFDHLTETHLKCFKSLALENALLDSNEYKIELSDDQPTNGECQESIQTLQAAFDGTLKSTCETNAAREAKYFEFAIKMRVLGQLQLSDAQKEREFKIYNDYITVIAKQFDLCRERQFD